MTARSVALPSYEQHAPTGRQAEHVLGSEPEKMPSHPFSETCNLSDGKYLKSAGRVRDSSSRRLSGGIYTANANECRSVCLKARCFFPF